MKYASKFVELKEFLDLCDIWGLRNTEVKLFTFCHKHLSGYLQRSLYYIFISNSLKEAVGKTDI